MQYVVRTYDQPHLVLIVLLLQFEKRADVLIIGTFANQQHRRPTLLAWSRIAIKEICVVHGGETHQSSTCSCVAVFGQIRVRNLTYNQPFSPIFFIAHTNVSQSSHGDGRLRWAWKSCVQCTNFSSEGRGGYSGTGKGTISERAAPSR